MSHQGYYTESSNFDNVNELLDQAELYKDQAFAYSEAAEASSLAAADSASQAALSAVDSQNSANDSAAQVSAAEAAAANALIYQDNAQAASINASTSEANALNYSLDAEASKDDAQVAQAAAEAAAANAAATLANALVKTNNLSDLTNVGTAQTNLGISPFVKTLLDDTTAGAVLTDLGVSAFMQTTLDDADAATFRATTGTNDATNLTTGSLPDARITQSGPTTPTLSNSFTDDGSATRYWKVGGIVYVSLTLGRTTTPSNATNVFTLPVGFRPSVNVRTVAWFTQGTPLAAGAAQVLINGSGVVQVEFAGSGSTAGSTGYTLRLMTCFPVI